MAGNDGRSGLFSAAFERSRNAMLPTDAQRTIEAADAAFMALTGRRRDDVVGRRLYEFVTDGPLATAEEWTQHLATGRFTGEAVIVAADGTTAAIQWAATVEVVTGREHVLFVAMGTSRWGARFRRPAHGDEPRALTRRERRIVHLVSLGASRAHLGAKALGEGLTMP